MSYLTTEEVAKMLRKKPETIQHYARQGELMGTKVGRGWLFTLEDVQAFLRRKQEPKRAL